MSTEEPTNQPIRVFLLDDHEVVRRGLRELLEGEPATSRWSARPATAAEAVAPHPARAARRRRARRAACPTATGSSVPGGPLA